MEQGERALALCRSFVLFVREKRKEGGEEGGGELRTVDRMAPLKICCGRRSLVRAATATTTSATVQNKTNASVPSQLAVSAAPPPGRTASPSRRLRRRESGGGFLQCRVSGGKKDESGLRFFLSALGTCTLAWFRPSRDFSAQGLQTNVEIILCFNALDEKRCKSRKEKPDAVPAKACRHRRRRLFGSSHS